MRTGGNHYVLLVLDSCRYDSFVAARPRIMTRLGNLEARWSYASWTSPSHYNLMIGLLPHTRPKHVHAAEYYRRDFLHFNERLGRSDIEFKSMVPRMYLPAFLRETLGYQTHARVSLPVLNPFTILNNGFDTYKLMDRHNDLRAMLAELTFPEDRPAFYLLNAGETHYPYALPDEPPDSWPRISGVHGVFKHLDQEVVGGKLKKSGSKPFDDAQLKRLRKRQVRAVEYVDRVVEELFDRVPRDTYITITSDHGELFGEDGCFGHGPVIHKKVFEVPFIEGKLR